MVQNIIISILLFLFSGAFALVFGQTTDASTKPTITAGDVFSISAKSMVIAAKTGKVETVLTEKTVYKRVAAEPFKTPNFATAASGAFGEIGVGDIVTVSTLLGSDGKSMNARTVYYVTKADMVAKAAKESEQWRTRGITGRVTTVNTQTNQVQVEITSLMGKTTLALSPKTNAKFMRYAPGSIRFDEALKSSLGEIKSGDEIRAIGDKSTDGALFEAEQVLTGAFQTIAGTIKSIDPTKNELVLDLQKSKSLTVVITETSIVKNYPPELAARMAGFQTGGSGMARPPGQGGQSPAGQGQAPRPGGGAGGPGGPRSGGGLDDMFMRFPDIKITDLKVGDVIAVVITKSDATSVRAIKLASGVEPFIRLAQATSGGQRGGQGGQGSFNIPGLDGFSIP